MTDKSRKAVPREATDAMLAAAMRAEKEYGDDYLPYGSAWRVMFDAAPVLATAPAEPRRLLNPAVICEQQGCQMYVEPADPPKEMHGENVGIDANASSPRPLGTRTAKSDTVESGATDVTAGRDRQSSGEVAALIERLRATRRGSLCQEAAFMLERFARLSAPVPDKEK